MKLLDLVLGEKGGMYVGGELRYARVRRFCLPHTHRFDDDYWSLFGPGIRFGEIDWWWLFIVSREDGRWRFELGAHD